MKLENQRPNWVSVGFDYDIVEKLTAVDVSGFRLMAVRSTDRLQVFSRDCPHRGADLTQGTLHEDGYVECRFHGRRVALGANENQCEYVSEFPVVALGPLWLTLLGGKDSGLREKVRELVTHCEFVASGSRIIAAPAQLIIENAFDAEHFESVHGVLEVQPIQISIDSCGALVGRTTMAVPRAPWQDRSSGDTILKLVATAYGPNLVVSHVGEPPIDYWVITATRPLDERASIADQILAFPIGSSSYESTSIREYMITRTQEGLEADCLIWEAMNQDLSMLPLDDLSAVAIFRRYCQGLG